MKRLVTFASLWQQAIRCWFWNTVKFEACHLQFAALHSNHRLPNLQHRSHFVHIHLCQEVPTLQSAWGPHGWECSQPLHSCSHSLWTFCNASQSTGGLKCWSVTAYNASYQLLHTLTTSSHLFSLWPKPIQCVTTDMWIAHVCVCMCVCVCVHDYTDRGILA